MPGLPTPRKQPQLALRHDDSWIAELSVPRPQVRYRLIYGTLRPGMADVNVLRILLLTGVPAVLDRTLQGPPSGWEFRIDGAERGRADLRDADAGGGAGRHQPDARPRPPRRPPLPRLRPLHPRRLAPRPRRQGPALLPGDKD